MKKAFSIIIFLSGLIANAQNTAPSLNTSLIPPSPDVAALGKFGIQPVTLYSGMTNVSIPITEIKTSKLSLPISLSYNYNGYRPGEEATSIGLGWSMQAGGVITRIVKGKADDAFNVPHKWQDYANILDLSSNPDFLADVAAGLADNEPDIYVFNFNGHSGKFILVGNRAFLFPKQDLNIISQGNSSGFYIYAGDGTIYDFREPEITTPANNMGNYTPPYTSAWFLHRIISDDWSEMITLQYADWGHNLPNSSYSETYTQKNGGPNNVGGGCTIGTCDTWTSNFFNGGSISSKRLTSITSKSAIINFMPESTARVDLGNDPTAFALKEIDIYSQPDNAITKKVMLSHDYFGSQQQLKLDAVTTRGFRTRNLGGTIVLDSLTDPPYTFDYMNEQGDYPKSTKGIDRWGYFNGVNNFWLFDASLTGGPLKYAFADRDVHVSALSNGLLSQITYPTGGYTTFDYENNAVRMPGANLNIIENKESSLTVPQSGGTTAYDSTFSYSNFDIDVSQNIKVYYSRTVSWPYPPPQCCIHNFHKIFKLYLINFDQNGDPLPPTLVYQNPLPLNPALNEDSVILSLDPGKYIYAVTCDGNALSASALIKYTITHVNAYQGDNGPGMRIKTINSYDNIDNSTPAITRSYTYGNGAKFISAPGYGANTILHHYDCGNYNEYVYTSNNSSSLLTLYSDQFYYPAVTEVNADSTITGKTLYEYTSDQADALGVILSAQTDYTARNNNYDIIKYKKNNYSGWDDAFPTISFWGFTTNISDVLDGPNCTPGISPLSGSLFDTIGRTILYHATSYALTSMGKYLMSTDETNYAAGQTNPLTVHTTYSYDNADYLSPSKTIIQNSKGETITTQTKYPLDYNLTSCNSLASIDATYKSSRDNSHTTYGTCVNNRYTAAWPYYNSHISNIANGPLMNILRSWKCEEQYPTNYAPVLNAVSNSSVNVYSCYDPAFHQDPDAATICLQRNNVQVPLEQIVSITKNGAEYLQSATKTDYELYVSNNQVYGANPTTLYQTDISQTPILKSTFLINPSNYYKPRVNFKYNTDGNIIEQSKTNDVKETYVWDYNNLHAIGKAINADAASVAATSFESNGMGNFNFSGTPTADQSAITGRMSYALSQGNITKSNLDPAKTYIVSYWSDNGAKNVNGTSALSGRSLNNFTYYEHKVVNPSGGTITISGNGKIDELRLYPEKALMTTYTYELLTGISSQCDADNKVSYYIYDASGRLQLIRDQDNYILKKFCYNYEGQPVNCAGQAIYHNVEISQTFYRNNCGLGYTGGPYTTTVAAGTYTSYISQADADQQAQNYINLVGQTNANAFGICAGFGVNCDGSNCVGPDKKCINNTCETGIKVYTSSTMLRNGTWVCIYHYEFSDGSWSDDFTENSPKSCLE